MKKILIGLVTMLLLLPLWSDVSAQSVGGLYYASLNSPLHIYNTEAKKMILNYEDSYFNIKTTTSSYPLRFFPEGTASYLIEFQDDEVIIPSGKTLTVAGTFAPTGSITMADEAYIGLGSAKGRLIFNDEATDNITLSTANLVLGALLDGNGTNAILNNTLADTLDITGELTATTIVTTGAITDGTYTSNGTGTFTGTVTLMWANTGDVA